MNQNDAPVGTLAYLGHPSNHRLIEKQDDGTWYLVRPMAVHQINDDDFRAGWHPLAIEAQAQPVVGGPPVHGEWPRCGRVDGGYQCTLSRDHEGQHVASGSTRIYRVWDQVEDNVTPEPVVQYRVDDRDPTIWNPAQACDLVGPSGLWVCTWDREHTGPHVAGDGEHILEVWSQ